MEPGQQAGSVLGREVSWGVCLLALIVIIGVWLLSLRPGSMSNSQTTSQLPFLGEVPDFALTERSLRPITKADLLGKVWIANFMFTQCPDECPLTSSRMATLQEAFVAAPEVLLVSITADPEHDTPAILARYADDFGADAQRWLFLTGDKEAIYRLALEGFHLGIGKLDSTQQSAFTPVTAVRHIIATVVPLLAPAAVFAHHDVAPDTRFRATTLHSTRFVLVDHQAHIRAYYDSTDPAALQRLQHDVNWLLHQP